MASSMPPAHTINEIEQEVRERLRLTAAQVAAAAGHPAGAAELCALLCAGCDEAAEPASDAAVWLLTRPGTPPEVRSRLFVMLGGVVELADVSLPAVYRAAETLRRAGTGGAPAEVRAAFRSYEEQHFRRSNMSALLHGPSSESAQRDLFRVVDSDPERFGAWLGSQGDPASIGALLSLLRQPGSRRATLERAIAGLGAAVLRAPGLDSLTRDEPLLQAAVLRALHGCTEPEALTTLSRGTAHAHAVIRSEACRALASVGDLRPDLLPVEALIAAMSDEREEELPADERAWSSGWLACKARLSAAAALSRLGEGAPGQIVEALGSFLRIPYDGASAVRRETVEALARLGALSPIDWLVEALDDESEEVRRAAAMALTKLHERVLSEVFLSRLETLERGVLPHVVACLGRTNDAQARAVFRRHVEEWLSSAGARMDEHVAQALLELPPLMLADFEGDLCALALAQGWAYRTVQPWGIDLLARHAPSALAALAADATRLLADGEPCGAFSEAASQAEIRELARLWSWPAEGWARALAALSSSAPSLRAAAAAAVIDRTSMPERVGAALAALQKDPAEQARIEVERALRLRLPESRALRYFPRGQFADEFSASSYAESLRSLGEAPLWPPGEQEGITYRFVWCPSFSSTVAVRVVRTAAGAVLINHDRSAAEREISASTWDEIEAHIARIGFWRLPTSDDRRGFDGADWIFEGRRPHAYHIVVRWSPESGDPFRALCVRLAELAGISQFDTESY